MNKIILIRHGESKWNKIGKIQGQKDIELTQKGRKQAKKLAEDLKKEKIDYIYTSDLERAYETANIISKELNKPIFLTKKLREINFGDWQGKTINQIKNKYKNQFNTWRKSPHLLSLSGAENLIKVQERSMLLLRELHKKHKNDNIILVSHGVTIKVLILSILDIDIENYRKITVDNCSLTMIKYIEDKSKIICLNERVKMEDYYD